MPCVHDFGIVEDVSALPEEIPCEPEKYGCIWIDDDYLDDWWPRLALLPTFFHTLDRPERGLARYGITLIPPESLPVLLAALEGRTALQAVYRLLQRAEQSHQFVIHFGI